MQLTIEGPSLWVHTQPVNFCKGIDGLLDIVLADLNVDPYNNIIIFYNRSRDKVKLLAWDKTGFVLLLKRLEKGRFFNALDDAHLVQVTPQQLSWLIAGLDWIAMTKWGELEYKDFH